MTADQILNPNLLVQPVKPGLVLPENLPKQGLFLLNFSPVLKEDVWDDYGNKERAQARRLRSLAARIEALANAMDHLGDQLKSYPDPDDYEMGDYEQEWDEVMDDMNTTFISGYSNLAGLVEELAEAAQGDFMD